MKNWFKENIETPSAGTHFLFVPPIPIPEYECLKYLLSVAENLDRKNENKITIGQLELLKQKVDERIAELSKY